jgi:hypothetical protein
VTERLEKPARSEEDIRLIDDFVKQIDVGDENLFVLIPCYVEETGLAESLSAYVESGIPQNCLFIVFINASDRIDDETFNALLDQRIADVESISAGFEDTQSRLVVINHRFESKQTLSRIRGLMCDAVAKSCIKRRIASAEIPDAVTEPDAEIVIVSNDADAISYSLNYLELIRKAFLEDPDLDYISGPISWSGMDQDGWVRYEPFVPLPEIYLNDLLSQIADDIYRLQSPVYSTGCNSAFRLSTLCTIGGYDYDFAPYFDVEIGRALNRYRSGRNEEAMKHCRFLADCALITNPRRAIHAHLENIPYGQQFENFGSLLGSDIDVEGSVNLYRQSKLFIQWEDLIDLSKTADKVYPRLTAAVLQWLEGEPTPHKKTLLTALAPKAGITVDTIYGDGEKIEDAEINWNDSEFLTVLSAWAARYQELE